MRDSSRIISTTTSFGGRKFEKSGESKIALPKPVTTLTVYAMDVRILIKRMLEMSGESSGTGKFNPPTTDPTNPFFLVNFQLIFECLVF
jgi:hypothetical protein